MYKIKLLILLLTSFILSSCVNSKKSDYDYKFSLNYIGGERDGLILKNYLNYYLNAKQIYDQSSFLVIEASISHQSNLFITNIDNTSDREKIISSLDIKIFNKQDNCYIYGKNNSISQFYIFAASDNFLSNQGAIKKIKKDNTESLVKKFIIDINNIDLNCKK